MTATESRSLEIAVLVAGLIEAITYNDSHGAARCCEALRKQRVTRAELIRARKRVLDSPHWQPKYDAIRERFNCAPPPEA